ncbi:MAG: acyltransferase, partial [Clostridia bacterium]|nr:acyltransferase [Clostridia bacterium]
FFEHFAMGIIAAGIAAKLYMNPERTNWLKRVHGFDFIGIASFLSSIVLLWCMRYVPEFSFSLQKQPYYFPLYALLIAATLAVTPHSNWFGKALDNRFFRFTAKVSFGLYIWHFLIIFIVASRWIKDYQVMRLGDLKVWAGVSLVILVASYIVAALSFKFIEKPVLDWAHKKKF